MRARRAAGGDEFADGSAHVVGILGAHVAHLHAVEAGDHRAQRDEFAHFRVASGHVFQSGGQAECAGVQVLFEDGLHPRQLGIGGATRAVVDAGAAAQCAVAGQGGNVDVGRGAGHGVHPCRQAVGGVVRAAQRGATAVLAQHDGGHAHRQVLGVGVVERIAVGMQVDEARRQHATAAFDDAQSARVPVGDAADALDAVAAHQHVGAPPRLTSAVDEQYVAQRQAAHRCLRRRARGQ